MLYGVFNRTLRTQNNSLSVTDGGAAVHEGGKKFTIQTVTNGSLFEMRS